MIRPSVLETLKKRPAFLAAAASGRKWAAPGLILQIKERRPAGDGEKAVLRYGLTASKRVGGAVVRNRARRRLRALAREVLARHGKAAYDYVLIARPLTVTRPFGDLKTDLLTALKRLDAWQDKMS